MSVSARVCYKVFSWFCVDDLEILHMNKELCVSGYCDQLQHICLWGIFNGISCNNNTVEITIALQHLNELILNFLVALKKTIQTVLKIYFFQVISDI